jgi:hypothetical protein
VHAADRFRISEDAGGVGDLPQREGGRSAVDLSARPDVTRAAPPETPTKRHTVRKESGYAQGI